MNLTIIDPNSRYAGVECRINYGPFSLREMGLALGMKHPIPVILLTTLGAAELETVVEAEHLLITDGPAHHCSECGEPNPDLSPEDAATLCCDEMSCDGTGKREWIVGSPAQVPDWHRMERVESCCEARADQMAQRIRSDYRAWIEPWEMQA